jgi:PAS domain-containing protein
MLQKAEKDWSTISEPAIPPWSSALSNLISQSESWLMSKILAYAKDRGYTKYTSTLFEAWRLSIVGISSSLVESLAEQGKDMELGPEEDYARDPAASFGILEARRHRERGVSLEMFLGLMKYYRQSYKDLVSESGLDPLSSAKGLLLVERFFDRMEIGFCAEWARSTENKLFAELQAANRFMTNEKNKYLTAFESLPSAVFILDEENRVENMNHSAALLFDESSIPGARYYSLIPSERGGLQGTAARIPVDHLLPWLSEDVTGFAKDHTPHQWIDRTVETKQGKKAFHVRLSRMLDVSGKFEGTILVLRDVTAQKEVEEVRLKKEKLRAILEMAGAVCHELNQPLQGLMGHAELLMLEFDREDPRHARVAKLVDLVHQMGQITKQLARITRYETRRYLDGKIIDIQKASELTAAGAGK